MYLLQNIVGKCRKLLLNKYIHSFWVINGTIVKNGRVYAVTHRNDLVELFPDNEVLADQVSAARLFLKVVAFVLQISSLNLLFQFFSNYMFRINGK